MNQSVLHKSNTRGYANHDWLKSHHSFSFAEYNHPERMGFGVLRVLNDDEVAPGMGFGTHPHNNMEIISIPLEGDLEHRDSMGNHSVIRHGDVQVMSAGTGIMHSEFNHNTNKPVKFLQIWVYPDKRNVSPRYDQVTLAPEERKNKLQLIVSPENGKGGVWIHQNAWFYLSHFTAHHSDIYNLNKTNNGIYIFILSGKLEVNGQVIETRDGYGLWNTSRIEIKAIYASEFLIMEVPMSQA